MESENLASPPRPRFVNLAQVESVPMRAMPPAAAPTRRSRRGVNAVVEVQESSANEETRASDEEMPTTSDDEVPAASDDEAPAASDDEAPAASDDDEYVDGNAAEEEDGKPRYCLCRSTDDSKVGMTQCRYGGACEPKY